MTGPSDFKYKDTRNCKKCFFPVQNEKSDSTPNDLVITAFFCKIAGLLPFVRTLRTTGSKATLVIFLEPQSLEAFTTNHHAQLNGCNVKFVNVGELFRPMVTNFIFLPVADYLRKNYHFIDRALYVDGFDSVFQGDPFTSYFKKNLLYFTSENITFKYNRWWYRFIQEKMKRYGHSSMRPNQLVINTGQLYGDPITLLRYFNYFFTWYNYRTNLTDSPTDQTYTNYFVHLGYFDRTGINYVIDALHNTCTATYLRIAFMPEKPRVFGYILASDSKTPAKVVHQYDMQHYLFEDINHSCPSGKYPVINFQRPKRRFRRSWAIGPRRLYHR